MLEIIFYDAECNKTEFRLSSEKKSVFTIEILFHHFSNEIGDKSTQCWLVIDWPLPFPCGMSKIWLKISSIYSQPSRYHKAQTFSVCDLIKRISFHHFSTFSSLLIFLTKPGKCEEIFTSIWGCVCVHCSFRKYIVGTLSNSI